MDNNIQRLDNTNYKQFNNSLVELKGLLYKDAPLGGVIKRLVKLMNRYSVVSDDKLNEILDSYQLICDYMFKGYDDPHRDELYKHLTRRLFCFMSDLSLKTELKYDSSATALSSRNTSGMIDIDDIREHLEAFVSDMAMLSLEADSDDKSQREKSLYEKRQSFISKVFIDVIRSEQWSRDQANDMSTLLLSPTIDIVDAEVLCSAVLMAALFSDDPNKVLSLVNIYKNATEPHLRQRALVGWVMAANTERYYYKIFPSLNSTISELLKDEKVRAEVVELQIQIIYCMGAEQDNETIRKDVIPSIMKNQNLEISRYGIREKEEDPMDDILHSGDEMDKRMEEMEKSVQKMVDMQKRGVDIYFGGFSKMKRFGFFYTICNWFMPFFIQHPGLGHISKNLLESDFLKALVDKGPFCDSDKYSFALGLTSVYEKLPANIREMLNHSEEMHILGDSGQDVSQPAYIRRLYLQDLYRFFRINDSRRLFSDPFSKENGLFMLNKLFGESDVMHAEAQRIERFLIKRKQFVDAENMLSLYYDENNVDDLLMKARISLTLYNRSDDSEKLYDKVLMIDEHNKAALKGAALTSFYNRNYDKAEKLYNRLSEIYPDKALYKLNAAICLINADKAEEGVNQLFEFYYKYPDNMDVRRALAWGLLSLKRLEQATKLYKEIIDSDNKNAADYLNAGYCAWFNGHYEEAVNLFKDYIKNQDPSSEVNLMKKFRDDKKILDLYEIPEVNRLIIGGMAE